MVYKKFLLKTFLLAVLLIAILAVIVFAMSGKFVSGQAVQEKTFLEQFVIAGGPIVWFVLLPMSVIMVYLIVRYSLTICRGRLLPAGTAVQVANLIGRAEPGQLKARISGRTDFISIAVLRAFSQSAGDSFRMRSAFAESLQDQTNQLLRKIEWLNLIGSISPMVGLFGTVFGMIKLFNTIVSAGGQPQPAQLADGISVALVTTFWGLFIAIPAVAVYGIFRNRIETLANDAVAETEKVITQIRQNLKKRKQNQKQQHPRTQKTEQTGENQTG